MAPPRKREPPGFARWLMKWHYKKGFQNFVELWVIRSAYLLSNHSYGQILSNGKLAKIFSFPLFSTNRNFCGNVRKLRGWPACVCVWPDEVVADAAIVGGLVLAAAETVNLVQAVHGGGRHHLARAESQHPHIERSLLVVECEIAHEVTSEGKWYTQSVVAKGHFPASQGRMEKETNAYRLIIFWDWTKLRKNQPFRLPEVYL